MTETITFIIPAFIAGLFTFLAPCTLPLVPGYLSFISGVSTKELSNPETAKRMKVKIFFNGVFFVLGFSAVFVLLGSIFSVGGIALGPYRFWLERIGGIFVIFFGLFMLGVLKLPFLQTLEADHRFKLPSWVKPGNAGSSVVFGGTFALGWTPCVGPVLGAVLTLAATSGSVAQGAFLLSVFSAGLAVPFLIIAATIGSASSYLSKISKYLRVVEVIGGVFLIGLGLLIFFDRFGAFIGWTYGVLDFLDYEAIYNFL